MSIFVNEKIVLYRIRHGDTEAFGDVYDAYSEQVYRFVYLKVPTAQDAEDLTAETFLKTWHYFQDGDALKKLRSLRGLLYHTARTVVVDFYRKRGTVFLDDIDEADVVIADRSDLSLEEKMALKSDLVLVEKALRQLKDTYRDVIVLHFLNELSLKEVSRIVERTPGATRVLLHRALKALRSLMREAV